jgi:glycosyltransferase involved in cell wall biosynthesis
MLRTAPQKLLFVHQNFPGQFRHLAAACARSGHQVIGLGHHRTAGVPGVRSVLYGLPQGVHLQASPWLADFEAKCLRAQAVLGAAQRLREEGFYPNVIVAHPGWGEAMFIKQVWPEARLGLYAEFFYRPQGTDVGFDPEFPASDLNIASRLMLKNAANFLQFPQAEAYLSPTTWQAATYPADWRPRMTVIHEGIDTDRLAPMPKGTLSLPLGLSLTPDAEVVTFVARNLEPYRGYHVFMRALPELFAHRPLVQVLIVGGDDTSYGSKPPSGTSWKNFFWQEVKDQLPSGQVHFLGKLPYEQYLAVMQRSDVHVYLTYPFVLSWSLLEAMSLGKAIVGSATPPVEEVIEHEQQGLLTPFFDTHHLVEAVIRLLKDPHLRKQLGQAARSKVIGQYDLHQCCLPQQLSWIERLSQLPLRIQ